MRRPGLSVAAWATLIAGTSAFALAAACAAGADPAPDAPPVAGPSPTAGANAVAAMPDPVLPLPSISRHVLDQREVAGVAISELSGLAWDADEQLLYAVSDQGRLYHFRITRAGDAVVSIRAEFAARLHDPAATIGSLVPGALRFNAEGLAVRNANNGLRGDSELIVALEVRPPQIARFSLAGELLGQLAVPAPANDIGNYRKKNRGLELVDLHPVVGLITAPEAPLRERAAQLHTVFAQSHAWAFARVSPDSRRKGLSVLPDGNLLVLERSRPDGSKDMQVATLRYVDIGSCAGRPVCTATLLAELPAGVENFEGLTVLDAQLALIVSDNGGNATRGSVFWVIALPSTGGAATP